MWERGECAGCCDSANRYSEGIERGLGVKSKERVVILAQGSCVASEQARRTADQRRVLARLPRSVNLALVPIKFKLLHSYFRRRYRYQCFVVGKINEDFDVLAIFRYTAFFEYVTTIAPT